MCKVLAALDCMTSNIDGGKIIIMFERLYSLGIPLEPVFDADWTAEFRLCWRRCASLYTGVFTTCVILLFTQTISMTIDLPGQHDAPTSVSQRWRGTVPCAYKLSDSWGQNVGKVTIPANLRNPSVYFWGAVKEKIASNIIPPIHRLLLLPSSSPLPSLAVVAVGELPIDETSSTLFVKHVVLRSLKSCAFHWYVHRQGRRGRVIRLMHFVDRRKFLGQGSIWPCKRLCSAPRRAYSHHKGRHHAYSHLDRSMVSSRERCSFFHSVAPSADSFSFHCQVLIANNGIVYLINHDVHILNSLQRYRRRQGNPLHSSMELRNFWNR